MKELLLLNEAVIWCFFAGIGVTGFLCGLVFRGICGRIRRRKEEKTIYLAVEEGTVPLDGLAPGGALGDGSGAGAGGR